MANSPTQCGQISFINTLPVVYPLELGLVKFPLESYFGNPQELNRLYAQGRLHVGAMSAHYFLQSQDFELLEGISISSVGAVGSVLLFLRSDKDSDAACKPDQLKIAVTAASASSVNLMKLLMMESNQSSVQSVIEEDPVSAFFQDHSYSGCLVIGDQALTNDKILSANSKRIDLGQWWQELSGLPFVFGVWAIRRTLKESKPALANILGVSLQESAKIGLNQCLEKVIDEAVRRTGLSPSRLRTYYLQELNFSLDESHLAGLRKFHELAKKHNLL